MDSSKGLKYRYQINRIKNIQKKQQKQDNTANPEFQNHHLQILNDLIDNNSSYFQQKVSIGQVKRPSKYQFKLKTKTGSTQYSKEYTQSIDLYNLKGTYPSRKKIKSLIKLPNYAIIQSSNYKNDYNINKKQKSQEIHQPQLYPIHRQRFSTNGPLFAETSDYKQYASTSIDNNVGMNMRPTLITFGGKFHEETTYNKAYVNTIQKPVQLILPKNHSVFTFVASKQQSTYKSAFKHNSKNDFLSSDFKSPLQTKTKSIPIIAHKKLKSQYANSYIEQLSAQKRQFQCLSKMELKKYLLNSINNK